jgi:hypothetical protein
MAFFAASTPVEVHTLLGISPVTEQMAAVR